LRNSEIFLKFGVPVRFGAFSTSIRALNAIVAGWWGRAVLQPRHCERSEAIHVSARDRWIASSLPPLRKRFAFIAGNDGGGGAVTLLHHA
jgi:hypothetical protein